MPTMTSTLFSSDGPTERWRLRWALRGAWRRTTRYTEARQRADGRWEYCCRQAGEFLPVGYCRGCDPLDTAEPDDRTASLFHRDGHATRQEAEACYRRYELDHVLVLEGRADSPRRCEAHGCDAVTHGQATLGHQRFTLCDAHRSRGVVAELAGDRAGACLCPQTAPRPAVAALQTEPPSDLVVPFPPVAGEVRGDRNR
jgi:hypothetical protein